MRWWAPRDRATTSRALGAVCLVGASISVLMAVFDHSVLGPGGAGARIVLVSQLVVVACGAVLLRVGAHAPAPLPLLVTVLLVGVTLVANLNTHDVSFAAQLFLLLPPLLTAALLPRGAFWTVAALVTVMDAVLLLLVAGGGGLGRDLLPFAAVACGLGAYLNVGVEREQEQVAQLRELADRDPLTGLLSRGVLTAAFAVRPCPPGALLLVDLDHLKRLNDTRGHAAGDAALRAAGEAVRAVAGPADLAVRLGGDEFALFLAGGDADDAVVAGEAVGRRVVEAGLAVSVGCAVSRREDTLTSLSRRADEALYRAKAGGRGRVVGPADDRRRAVPAAVPR
ncbi:GGDEF domain-containing protein [Kineococcus gynurae]|uniref:GGDEF domain-containing protein n=1 Tax=Kineococcus gynurae TaxID=452979 RepID=A0ABV5LVP1_9ACTN